MYILFNSDNGTCFNISSGYGAFELLVFLTLNISALRCLITSLRRSAKLIVSNPRFLAGTQRRLNCHRKGESTRCCGLLKGRSLAIFPCTFQSCNGFSSFLPATLPELARLPLRAESCF